MVRRNNGFDLTLLAYINVCIIWGSTNLAMRIAVSQFPPELFTGIRFLLAGAIIFIFAMVKKYIFPNSIFEIVKAAIPGILVLAVPTGLVMYAMQWVHSGIASIILAMTPLFVVVIEFLIFRDKKIGGWDSILLILGFISTLLLLVNGTKIGSIDIKGGLLIVLASFIWAIGSIYSNKVKCYGNLITHIGIQLLCAGLFLTLLGLFIGEFDKIHITSDTVISMAYLVVFGSIIGYSSNMLVLREWPTYIAVTSNYISPIIAVILGVLILNESINYLSVIFMFLTLFSIVALHFRR